MKRIVSSFLVALLLVPALAQANQRKYGMAGCGLGSIVMGQDGGQISAATTNSTSYSQVGGITSGTSNCEPDEGGKTTITIGQEMFMSRNFVALSKEMAQGDGETLRAFAQALGCRPEVYTDVASQLQRSYGSIFSAPGAVDALETAKSEVRKNPSLAAACLHVG